MDTDYRRAALTLGRALPAKRDLTSLLPRRLNVWATRLFGRIDRPLRNQEIKRYGSTKRRGARPPVL